MLSPYGRAPPPRPPCALDRWTGAGWRLLERHELPVDAAPAAALDALAGLRLRELPAVRALFALRGMPFDPDMTLRAFFSTAPFVALEDEPGGELVGGILVPPRGPDGRRRTPRTPAEFADALRSAPMAAVATFRADSRGEGALLWTETWVRTGGLLPAAVFGAYWLVIGPWSAWIRRMFLRGARARVAAAS